MKRLLCFLLAFLMLVTSLEGCAQSPVTTDPDDVGSEFETLGNQTDATVSTVPTETTAPAVQIQPSNVIINEVMPDNEKLCLGHEDDWIELYNLEETPVDLTGYFLTDDLQNPQALSLSGLQISAQGYLLVTLDDSAAFRLSSSGESVYLVCGERVISEMTFAETTEGESVDSLGICTYPTPGFANTQDGYLEYLSHLTLPELIINEAMSSNSKHLPVKGENYDLVELKNNSDQPLDLSGYYLSDKRSEPQRYALPQITLQPGEFMVIYCSGNPSLGSDHTSFKLSADGETLYLSKDGSFVDILPIPAQLQKNESYGRDGNVPVFLTQPTFGEENTGGYLTGLAAPTASVASGIYSEPVTVTLSGEGEIYYTLDGRRPTTSSARYTEPITITGVTTVRTFCVSADRSSAVTAYTYAVDVEHELPVVVVSIPQSRLTGEQGVLNHIDQNYEYEAMLTLIEDGEEKFSVPCGFRLHGNGSRQCPKQNFQLRFRSDYGVGRLEYKLFDDLEIDSFNSLLLKGGSEDWYRAVMRDEVATAMANESNLYTQAMKPVILYLGGKYWGIYYIRERFSDDYVASHLGVSEESVDMVYSTGAYAQCGSNDDFLELRNYCQTHDMSTEENYAYLASQIDVMSLIDWYIFRMYVGDQDLANIRRFRSSESDGLWRWMYFDLDWSFSNYTGAYFSHTIANVNGDRILMQALLKSQSGRDLFLKRCAELMRTFLNEEYIVGIVDSIVAQIEPEIVKDRKRWSCTYAGWESEVQIIRDYVSGGTRTRGVLKDLQEYFSLSDAEMEYYFEDIWQNANAQ